MTTATFLPARSLLDHPVHMRLASGLLLLLLALPPLAQAFDGGFYIGLASRILIFALAATSLNLILGFGGMVSFGHAAFMGVGGYAVGILMQHGRWPSRSAAPAPARSARSACARAACTSS